ncbi:MAG: class I tRNA ligase family protein, partial [Bacteroidales bacterium]|nr:class I tRNA ligase family protein [Bacteroidales bacterium]
EDLYSKFRLSEALMVLYRLFWDEFSSWYLELIKPAFGEPIDRRTYDDTLYYFESLLKLLHPFMPFITEELWQAIQDREEGASIMVAQIATTDLDYNDSIVNQFEDVKSIVTHIRSIRTQKNIPYKDELALHIIGENKIVAYESVLNKMCNLSEISSVDVKEDDAASFLIGTTEFTVPIGDKIDVEAELEALESELKHKEGFLKGIMKKLQNTNFVDNAPAAVVEMERKKKEDTESIIQSLKESIEALKK